MRFLAAVAGAVGAIAPTAAFWMLIEDRASPEGDIAAIFAFEENPFGGQQPSVEAAMEGAASERTQRRQVVGVDIDLSPSVVLFVEQVDQFPGGIAVKVAARTNMQVAVIFFEFDMKIIAHEKASVDRFAVNVRGVRVPAASLSF
jgi:hypothetical protein